MIMAENYGELSAGIKELERQARHGQDRNPPMKGLPANKEPAIPVKVSSKDYKSGK